jgi:quinol-cytochrome oxidoreductase complex cytochrome b subunit
MTQKASIEKGNISGFFLHLHPKTVAPETMRFTLSFGLGGMAATLLLTLLVTGLLQLLSYSAEVSSSYLSVLQMYESGSIAGFIRNIHFWTGNLLVVVVFLHMVRVLATGALGEGRRLNWLIGLVLFILILFGNFTGYLMPWDQLAFWAVTIFTAMAGLIPFVGEQLTELLRGGTEVGQETLANFFAIHVGVIPVVLSLLCILHFWLVRKAGGLVQKNRAGSEPGARIQTVPHLIVREAAVAFALLSLVLLWSAFIDAPLGAEANPGESPNPAKAAWYFMGLQELLLHLHPTFAVCIIPLLSFAALASLPLLKNHILPGGSWFGSRTGVQAMLFSSLLGLLTTVLFILADDLFFSTIVNAMGPAWFSLGLLPLTASILSLTALYFCLRKLSASPAEAMTGLVFFVYTTVITLTCTGIWFRGKEMALIWPL